MPHPKADDQLPSQTSKTHRQHLCLPESLTYWLSGFYEEPKVNYSLHKNYWGSLYFHEKVLKEMIDLLKDT